MIDESRTIGQGEFQLPAEYFQFLLKFSTRQGLAIDYLLEGSFISAAELLSNPDFVGNDSYNAVVAKLLEKAGDPLIPWRYGMELAQESHGLLGMIMRSASSLESLYKVLASIYTARVGYSQTVETRRNRNTFDIFLRSGRPSAAPEIVRFNTISGIMNITWITRFVTATEQKPVKDEVYLPWPDPGVDGLAELLPPGLTLKFDEIDTLLRQPRSQFQSPIISSSPDMLEAALRQSEVELKLAPANMSTSDGVRWVFRILRPYLPTIEVTAPRLNMSPATLTRRLKSEGTTYQKEKDRVRFSWTEQLLLTTDYSLQEIADKVSFDNPSNLSKAFKARYGITPGEFRKLKRQDGTDK